MIVMFFFFAVYTLKSRMCQCIVVEGRVALYLGDLLRYLISATRIFDPRDLGPLHYLITCLDIT